MHTLLQDESLIVRRRANEISDADVDDSPPVAAVLRRLRKAEEEEREFRKSPMPEREALGAVNERIAAIRNEAQAIEAARLTLVVRIAKGTSDDAEDRFAQAKLQDLNRQRDVLDRALPTLQRELAQAQIVGEQISTRTSEARMALDTARVVAKIKIAREGQ